MNGKTGIYIIRENNQIVYIGYSAKNLYRTLYRHFQGWNHPFQQVVTYNNSLNSNKYTVSVTLCPPKMAERLERILVIKHKPRDNENKYAAYTMTAADSNLIQQYNETLVTEDTEIPF